MFGFLLFVCFAAIPIAAQLQPEPRSDNKGQSKFSIFPEHYFNIDGQLTCAPHRKWLNLSAVVSIWEADYVTQDDLIGTVKVAAGRFFKFTFRDAEFGRIRPYMIIFHDCYPGVKFGQCYAKTTVPIIPPNTQGETIFIDTDLLNTPSQIVCNDRYPFQLPPPSLEKQAEPIIIRTTPTTLPPTTTVSPSPTTTLPLWRRRLEENKEKFQRSRSNNPEPNNQLSRGRRYAEHEDDDLEKTKWEYWAERSPLRMSPRVDMRVDHQGM